MPMKRGIIIAAFFICALFVGRTDVPAQIRTDGVSSSDSLPVFSMNEAVISQYLKLSLMARDEFWKKKLNMILESKGTISAVEEKSQFRRRYRITVTSGTENKLLLVYYIYTDNEEYIKILQPGEIFGFKGQFVMFTPVNTKRNAYILDLILEDGATIIE
ncbi:MAG: hypothetical protein ACRCUT_14530 [Spirochaetota bacterium]